MSPVKYSTRKTTFKTHRKSTGSISSDAKDDLRN